MDSSANATCLPPPPVIWAQRKDKVLLTIQLENVSNPKVTLKDSDLYFHGKGGTANTDHEVQMEFFKEINSSVHYLKTDFEKWRDEDDSEVDDRDDLNLDEMMQSMGGLQGGGAPDLGDNEDSDDEDLPDLQ